jgi:hypothetical protein
VTKLRKAYKYLAGKQVRKSPFGRPRRRCGVISKWILNK